MKIIVLAGGKGSRLWPLSTSKLPKQFLNFWGEGTLLQQTVKRFSSLGEVLVVAGDEKLCKQQVKTPILIEPCPKGTLPAIALGVKHLNGRGPILVVPSDQLVSPEEEFIRSLREAEKNLKKEIIVFGIKPTKAETGFGYIERGEKSVVKQFIEKPILSLAREYFSNENFFWNMGMFLFYPEVFWQEVEKYAPEIYGFYKGEVSFSDLPSTSFDYAIMEKTSKASMYEMKVLWSDVGSFDSIYEIMEKENGNVKVGKVVDMETKNSLLFAHKRLIATIGLEDIIVVETDEAVLVAKRGESQKIKELLKRVCDHQ